MSNIDGFSQARIGASLVRQELRWLRAPEGAFVVDFATEVGPMRVLLSAEGTDGSILVVRVTSARSFGPDYWPALLALVNIWNQDYRFAKAYTTFVDDDRAVVVAEFQVALGSGVHDELLDQITAVAIDAGVGFHRFVTEKLIEPGVSQEALSAEELESWLHRSA